MQEKQIITEIQIVNFLNSNKLVGASEISIRRSKKMGYLYTD